MRIKNGIVSNSGITINTGITINNGLSVGSTGVPIIPPVLSNTIFGVTKLAYAGFQAAITFTDSTSYVPITLPTIALGTQTGLTDNNDGSFTNISGNTQKANGLITISGADSTSDLRIVLVAESDESGSWQVLDEPRGGVIRDNANNDAKVNATRYSLTLSEGKSVRFSARAYTYGGQPSAVYRLVTLEHMIWGHKV